MLSALGQLLPIALAVAVSSVPITLYQFNPLEFELVPPPIDCPLLNEVGTCNSYTNDASLMLPTTALRDDYYVITRPTLHLGFFGTFINLPGFVAVTATADGTTVTVDTPAHVRASLSSQKADRSAAPLEDGLVQISFNRPELFRVLLNHRTATPQAAVVSKPRG